MENNSKFDKFASKLTYLLNGNEAGEKKPKETFFNKVGIAILTSIGILLIIIIIMVALRFVVQPAYWYLVDSFAFILLVTLTYFIVIRKLFKKK